MLSRRVQELEIPASLYNYNDVMIVFQDISGVLLGEKSVSIEAFPLWCTLYHGSCSKQ